MRTTKKLYQWDTDQKLFDCDGKYVDFPIGDEVYRIEVIDKECIIPDELLQVSGTVKVYECMEYGTVKAFAFYINPRPMPPDYVFTPTQRLTFEGLVKKVDETIGDLQKRADSGEFNGRDYVITESDYDAIAAKTAGKLQPTIGELARTLETEKTDRERADISLQKDISGKLSEPVEGLAVGKYFRVAQIDENGHAVLEAVDAPKEGLSITPTGWPAWTAEEQAAARERLGVTDEFNSINTSVGELKGDLVPIKEAILKENRPLFGWEIGSINTTGANIDSTNTIRTESGVYYTFPAGTEISVLDDSVQFVVAIYESSTASRTAWASTPVVLQDNCRIRIAMRKTDQSALDDTSISVKLVYQKQYDSTIEEVKYDFAKSNAIIIDEGVNLLNIDDADIVENYYISRTGFELPESGLFISGYIKCNKNDIFCFNTPGTYLDECVYVYDSHKEWISNQIATDVSNNIRQVTIQYTNAAYIRFAVNTNIRDTAMIVRGDTYPDEYIPYKNEERKLMDDVYLGTQAKNDVVAMVASMGINNPLVGKKIAVTGDSICFGAGNDGVGYVGIIAERNNMTYQNLAVSGATITDTTSIQSSNVCITNTIANLDSNADYIILEGGVNDASYDVELGTPNPLCVFYETPTTFYGWLDKMFGSVRIKFPTKKIGFIIVHQTQKKFSAFHNGAYYNAIVEMCNKWGIPYCDLNKTCPPFTRFSAEGNAELYAIRQAYTKNGDGWHPNDDGYRLFYVPQIESWLKTL